MPWTTSAAITAKISAFAESLSPPQASTTNCKSAGHGAPTAPDSAPPWLESVVFTEDSSFCSSPAWATILKRNYPLTIIDIPMQKIPSLFQRDYKGNRQVIDQVVDGCQWVLLGEGMATEKIDGTCCMIRDGELFRRHDRKQGKPAPNGWIAAEPAPDPVTGHWPGWTKITDTPADRWHREAFDANRSLPNGTYELVGPKIQGNAYELTQHELRSHESAAQYPLFPRSFDAIREALQEMLIEGIVWHHPDGRMCKIKRRDFGLPWPVSDC